MLGEARSGGSFVFSVHGSFLSADFFQPGQDFFSQFWRESTTNGPFVIGCRGDIDRLSHEEGKQAIVPVGNADSEWRAGLHSLTGKNAEAATRNVHDLAGPKHFLVGLVLVLVKDFEASRCALPSAAFRR